MDQFACIQLLEVEGYMKSRYKLGYLIAISWIGTAAITDVIITSSLVYYLSRSKTIFRQTNHVLVLPLSD